MLSHASQDPSPFVVEALEALRAAGVVGSGWALDVACGHGRHSRLLAEAGYEVLAADRDRDALRTMSGDRVHPLCVNLEDGSWEPPPQRFGLVLQTFFLWRPLWPALLKAVRPGGGYVMETFTTAELQRRGRGTPAFYLNEKELGSTFADWQVVAHYEGVRDGRHLAGIAAMRPPAGTTP